jgi:aspirochlorine biosynthesis cytochrome P450 monooxygenase
MVDQLAFALATEVGDASNWKTFNIAQLMANVVNILVSRMLVGQELGQDLSYIRQVQDYVTSFLANGFGWPIRPPWPIDKWVFWICAYPMRRKLRRSLGLLVPAFRERMSQLPSQDPNNKPLDMIQWLLEMPVKTPEEGSAEKNAERMLHLTFASTAVSMGLMINLTHQILENPEYVEPLRKEIAECLDTHGGWTEKALSSMHLVDSYIRETMRFAPPSVCE